ncbi:YpdA family putative bacillithiol disulfide reductase [Salinibacillus xinjiangensis]|uniref:YpdA family putative bacillithiol disulfide reductase n=1 Tax=Salinibacillus xinjiangensis TaxID=1229268 RepID=A0A6G1X6I8_9BACI|nr:YpdA family putative bacillithiol disulfide reductase [Salinibacillus xinjiangensis]MRG86428.1 YpdA family putative bacillithiol disulfide reductase [Salinibacillus xinjiangensis]
MENKEKIIIIGAGPCGLSAAIELQSCGLDPLLIEKGNVVDAIYHYPTHQTFFSSSEKLEIGDIPFISEKQKPVRNEALSYYRTVAERRNLRINTYETVTTIEKEDDDDFRVETEDRNGNLKSYISKYVIVATGYYGQPNLLHIPGEELDKVMHYFKEAHPYFNTDVVVIGGKNSAVDATLELVKAGARVTVIYRGSEYSKSVKPWILPLFDSLVRKGIVNMIFDGHVTEITKDRVYYTVGQEKSSLKNDFVFAMTGYHPDHDFLASMDIKIDEKSGRPKYNEETMESNIPNIYIAGVIAAGFNNNEIFIENGRFHGKQIANSIVDKENSK